SGVRCLASAGAAVGGRTVAVALVDPNDRRVGRGVPGLGGGDRLAALGRLPHELAVVTLHPLAFGVLDAAARLLLLELRLALDVDTPTGEPGGEACVLALFADGEGELEVGDDHLGGARLG